MATAASLGLLALLMLPGCSASCLQAHDRRHVNSFELFACLNASTPLSFDSRGGREGCRIIVA